MPDVGASQPWNPGPPAPVTGDLFLVHPEVRFVRGDVAAAAEHDARHPPDLGVAGDVKQRSINPVECLAHLFQHEHMSGEVRLQRRAEYLAEHRHVECCGLVHAADRGLQHLWRPIDHPGEGSLNRCVSRISQDVLRHGTVCNGLEPSPIQGGKQHTGIAVAQVDFSSGRLCQPAHDRFRHAAGAVTAAREPHGVVALVIGDVEESLYARFVIAGEMSARSEALRVEDDLRRPVRVTRSGQRLHSLGNFRRHARSWRDDADPAPLVAHQLPATVFSRPRRRVGKGALLRAVPTRTAAAPNRVGMARAVIACTDCVNLCARAFAHPTDIRA